MRTTTGDHFYPAESCKRLPELVDEAAMKYYGSRKYSHNTCKKIGWAITVFSEWKAYHNFKAIKCPELKLSKINCELEHMTKDELNYVLSRLVVEIRKGNGEMYPGKSLYELVICL